MTMVRTRVLMLGLSLVPFIASAARAADLTVTVKEVRNAKGSVLVAVYDGEASFGKPELAKARQKAQAHQGELTFVFHDLKAGTYAVAAFHDENGNGKLDRNALGVPTEGWGFSNDAQGNAGPPKFTQAAFDLDGQAEKSIDFSLNY